MILPENVECHEIYDLCYPCREGFGGNLDYRFVGTVLDRFGFDGEEWIGMLKKIQTVEGRLRELRDKEPQGV